MCFVYFKVTLQSEILYYMKSYYNFHFLIEHKKLYDIGTIRIPLYIKKKLIFQIPIYSLN